MTRRFARRLTVPPKIDRGPTGHFNREEIAAAVPALRLPFGKGKID